MTPPKNSDEKNEFMRSSAVLCIAIMAPLGVVLQKLCAQPLLSRCKYEDEETDEEEGSVEEESWDEDSDEWDDDDFQEFDLSPGA